MYGPVKCYYRVSCYLGSLRLSYSIRKRNYYEYSKHKLLKPPLVIYSSQMRQIGIFVRVVRNFLKLRYIFIGSAVGGGLHITKKFDEWKENLPDFKAIKDSLPQTETITRMTTKLLELGEKYGPSKEWTRLMSERAFEKFAQWNQMIEEARAARKLEMESQSTNNLKSLVNFEVNHDPIKTQNKSKQDDIDKIRQLKDEMMNIQVKYQREITKLEKENRDLKKQLLLKSSTSKLSMKRSLIDLYSDVLDELSGFNSSIQDHLPRVVVIGDQSAGKTSVLEMIAGARIFPRGAGEMMTRAPVKVALSEGPYHIAKFNNSPREFDLTKESELVDLRREVELRMRASVKSGKTVSNEVISMTVQGPGIQRMILVDLPGVINTPTYEMAEDTRETIKEITETHMSNPNAIILCVQDGSVDPERSIVTEIASKMDPYGKRTIFVLTKVDLAEQNMADPNRIKKILEGKLFPMKALGYFAVVTGKGSQDENIHSIKQYEQNFFQNSKLCKDGMLKTSQCSTNNLSFAVSECFWKMVKASIEQEADSFKATKYNLEMAWRHKFSKLREMARDELFEIARNQILDEVVNLSQIKISFWEEALFSKLWAEVENFLNDLYFQMDESNDSGSFNFKSTIKLKEWIEQVLPELSIKVAREVLQTQFSKLLTQKKCDLDDILINLKMEVAKEAWLRHNWDVKAYEVLRVLQLSYIDDFSISNKRDWDQTIDFAEKCLKLSLVKYEQKLNNCLGPGLYERWMHWKSLTNEQLKNAYIKVQLDKIVNLKKFGKKILQPEELLMIENNLKAQEIYVDKNEIQLLWEHIFKVDFLKNALNRLTECRKCFYLYDQGFEIEVKFDDVIFFWKIQKIINSTVNALRKQLMNKEGYRLEQSLKEVLDDFSLDEKIKTKLLNGESVELAEELKRVKNILKKLEDFIDALNNENQ